jgi:hypothetical protein
MTIEFARREATLFETLMLQQLCEPIFGDNGVLGEVGAGYITQTVAEHDESFGDVIARVLQRHG